MVDLPGPNVKLMILDVSKRKGSVFRPVAIYVYTGPERPDIFKYLIIFHHLLFSGEIGTAS